MEFFTIQRGGSSIVRTGKSGRSQKVSENVLNKAMQKGGGMMFNPKSGKVLMWPGMWSPSDIGKPDCGTPVVTRLVEPEEPVRKAIASIVSVPEKPYLRSQIDEKMKEASTKSASLEKQVKSVDTPTTDPQLLSQAKGSLKKYQTVLKTLPATKTDPEYDQKVRP